MGLGGDGLKTLGGLNPKQSLAHIDSSMRTVKIGAEAFATDLPDPIDAADSNDAQCVVPYIKDIMRCMRETEVRRYAAAALTIARFKRSTDGQRTRRASHPSRARLSSLLSQGKYLAPPTYMTQQTDVNEKMRAILIDWLIEVHLKFKLVPETMYVTVNLIDRFLAKKSIPRNKLQLVGVTAMFIASKYEEIYAPEVRDFVYISDKAYSREEILKMEGTLLGVLNFNVTAPSPYAFLKRFVKVAGWLRAGAEESREERLCSYLVELTLQEYRMLKYLPSVIAASAVCLAQKMLRSGSWVRARPQPTPSRPPVSSLRVAQCECIARRRMFCPLPPPPQDYPLSARCTASPTHCLAQRQPAHLFFSPPRALLSSAASRAQSTTMQQHTCYPEATLLPCIKDMNAIAKAAGKNSLAAVRKKYTQEKFGGVAQIETVEV